MNDATSIYVDKFYRPDPEFDDVLFSGADLQVGMIVLLESSLLRVDIDRDLDRHELRYEKERANETNRWCTIERIEVKPRAEHDSPLVKFLAVYPDGDKKLRAYDASFGWIVKKESM